MRILYDRRHVKTPVTNVERLSMSTNPKLTKDQIAKQLVKYDITLSPLAGEEDADRRSRAHAP